MSAGGFSAAGAGASTLGVSVTLGASTTDVVFNTALDTALGAVAFLAVAVTCVYGDELRLWSSVELANVILL